MKISILPLIIFSFTCMAQPKDTLDLFYCQQMALKNHPSYREKALYRESAGIKLNSIISDWYPSLDVNGSYTWQNEVVTLPFADMIPGIDIPQVPHYNYKLTLDVRQTLYEGGITKAQRELEESNLLVNQKQVDVGLYQVRENVNRVYFRILLLEKQEKTLQLKEQVLAERIQILESGVRNEIASSSDLYVLQAELLGLEQELAGIRISRSSAIKILAELMHQDLPENLILRIPRAERHAVSDKERPEEMLFQLQINKLDAGKTLLKKQRYPRLYVFGQLGYGNPALDFFRDEFRGFYIVGAGINWKLWDWNKARREREELNVQQEIIHARNKTFDQNLSIQEAEIHARISQLKEALARDRKILALREEISRSATSQYENGIITVSEYIRELNAETESRIVMELHRIQLIQAQIDELTIHGNI